MYSSRVFSIAWRLKCRRGPRSSAGESGGIPRVTWVIDNHRNVDFRRLQKCRDVTIHEVFAEGFFRGPRGLLYLLPIFLYRVFSSIKFDALFVGTCLVSTTVVPTRRVL